MRFYFKHWNEETDVRVLGTVMGNDELLFDPGFLDWIKENKIVAQFCSKNCYDSCTYDVLLPVEEVTNAEHDQTSAIEDSIVIENTDHAMLFKLTWL